MEMPLMKNLLRAYQIINLTSYKLVEYEDACTLKNQNELDSFTPKNNVLI